MNKKIIGYQFKNEPFRKSFAQLMGYTDTYEGKFITDSHVYKSLVALLVLDLWCDPIYEEDKLFLDDEKTIEVVKIDNYNAVNVKMIGISFPIDDYGIDKLIEVSYCDYIDIYIYNHKVSLKKLREIKEMLNK